MTSNTRAGSRAEETVGTEDGCGEDADGFEARISRLLVENERYKQESHHLRRKLEISRSMEAELGEINKTLEESLARREALADRRIRELEETYAAREKDIRDRLVDAEGQLAKRVEENGVLRETIRSNEERLSALNQSRRSSDEEERLESSLARTEELRELLEREGELRERQEEIARAAERENQELREILAGTKNQLAEANRAIEFAREELTECRAELQSLRTLPAEERSKGNSLFAEVEDRRKMIQVRMNAMQNSYLEAKRTSRAKEAEIRSLKAERTLLLRKWEDDTVERVQQDASLVERYKTRIGELESRLKEETKRRRTEESRPPMENNLNFLQSLVDERSKKIEELSEKIENASIKTLLEEENRHKMGKQLRYWRYRAMSCEAELLSIKNRLESEPSSRNIELSETMRKRLAEKNSESDETLLGESGRGESSAIVDETVVTLETLMTVPNLDVPDQTIENAASAEAVTGTIDDARETMRNCILTERRENIGNRRNEPALKSMLGGRSNDDDENFIIPMGEKNKKEKKVLRFTTDTADPPSKPLKKQSTLAPKYPIVFISSDKSKK